MRWDPSASWVAASVAPVEASGHQSPRDLDLVCAYSGGAFRVGREDDWARAFLAATLAGTLASSRHSPENHGLIDAFVAPTAEGIALLPGSLAHPAEAFEPINALIAQAHQQQRAADDLFDALLAMRHKLSALSRVRPHHVYR